MPILAPRESLEQYIGHECEPTNWHLIDQEQINGFADNTLDQQFIHVDPEAAAKTPFGGTIAHGFLTLSMLAHFAEQFSIVVEGVVMGINYGFDKVRFLAPVKVGKRIRAVAKVADISEKKPGQILIKYDITIEIEGEPTPALVCEWFGLQMVPV